MSANEKRADRAKRKNAATDAGKFCESCSLCCNFCCLRGNSKKRGEADTAAGGITRTRRTGWQAAVQAVGGSIAQQFLDYALSSLILLTVKAPHPNRHVYSDTHSLQSFHGMASPKNTPNGCMQANHAATMRARSSGRLW